MIECQPMHAVEYPCGVSASATIRSAFNSTMN